LANGGQLLSRRFVVVTFGVRVIGGGLTRGLVKLIAPPREVDAITSRFYIEDERPCIRSNLGRCISEVSKFARAGAYVSGSGDSVGRSLS